MNENTNGTIRFKAFDDAGRQIDCVTLFMFDSPETGKNYIVYTDNSLDEEGNTKVYASIYNPDEIKTFNTYDEKSEDDNVYGALQLKPIETEKEWTIIERILEQMQAQIDSETDK